MTLQPPRGSIRFCSERSPKKRAEFCWARRRHNKIRSQKGRTKKKKRSGAKHFFGGGPGNPKRDLFCFFGRQLSGSLNGGGMCMVYSFADKSKTRERENVKKSHRKGRGSKKKKKSRGECVVSKEGGREGGREGSGPTLTSPIPYIPCPFCCSFF